MLSQCILWSYFTYKHTQTITNTSSSWNHLAHTYIRTNFTKLKKNNNKKNPYPSQESQNNKVIVKVKDTGIPSTHFPWHLHTIKCRGQRYWNKQRQFHPFAHTKPSDPSYYSSLRHFLFLISRCSSFLSFFFFLPPPFILFYFKKKWLWTPPSHFPFLQHFHFIKLQSMCFVCGEKGMAHSVVVSATAYIGGSSSLRIRSLCVMKGYEKSVI